MDPISLAVTGGAQLASNVFTSLFNRNQQKEANKQNLKIAREQMAFQERMSNTAVQRHAKDLEAAGFNRLLAAGANGASTPGGSSATMKPAEITPLDIIGIEKTRADISKTNADTAVALATVDNLSSQNENLSVQNTVLRRQAEKLLVDMGYTRVQAAKIIAEGAGDKVFKTEGSGGVPGFIKGSHNNTITVPNVTVENAMSRVPF